MRRTLLLAAALAIPLSGASLVAATHSGIRRLGEDQLHDHHRECGVDAHDQRVHGGEHGWEALQPVASTALAAGGTITWVSGSSTTIGKPTTDRHVGQEMPRVREGGLDRADRRQDRRHGDRRHG